ncbi:MAG: shikimate dehydrogenase [Acidiferrobacterales bacterium]|nr:shikimate dehydrogenase [Acidiferrobacterales bacterium]
MSDPNKGRQLYAVMGHPVAHSKSPAIHQAFAKQCGITLEYRAIEIEPARFAEAVQAFRDEGGTGLNITVPFKLEAYALADRCSARAEQAGAVNTLKVEADHTLYGDNTDGIGLVCDLVVNLGARLADRRVLVVGAGGAVRGILGPILEEGVAHLHLANRTPSKAQELATLFAGLGNISASGLDELGGETFNIVINATAASLQREVPSMPASVFALGALAYDLMYGDTPTAFMQWAQRHGATRVSDGLGMLVEQAAESFLLWHGRRPETAPVIASLRAPG